MTTEPSEAVKELAQGAELTSIFCRFASVELLDQEREGDHSPLAAGLTVGRRKAAPNDPTREFRITFDLGIQLPAVNLQTIFIAQYSTPASMGELLTDAIITEYANHVAVMTLLPYARESLSDLARRVGVDFTLPILQRGQLVFEAPSQEASPRI